MLMPAEARGTLAAFRPERDEAMSVVVAPLRRHKIRVVDERELGMAPDRGVDSRFHRMGAVVLVAAFVTPSGWLRGRISGAGIVLAVCLGLLACSGAPKLTERVQEGEACRVDYHNARSETTLSIVNTSYRDELQRDGKVSRTDDQVVRVLLSDYENLGFFERSRAALPVGKSDWLAVRSSRGVWVFPRPRDTQGLTMWHSLVKGFTAVWNTGDRAVTGGGFGSGRSALEAERKRLEQLNQRVRSKLRSGR